MNTITLYGEITFVSKVVVNKGNRRVFWFGLDSEDYLRYLDGKDNIVERKIYHTIVLFDDFAEEVCSKLKVGQTIEVVGRLAFSRISTGMNSEKILPRIVANEVKIIQRKSLRYKNEGKNKKNMKNLIFKEKDIDISDLPFD